MSKRSASDGGSNDACQSSSTSNSSNNGSGAALVPSCSSSSGAAIAAPTGQPPIKKVHFEPHLIGPVSTLEELDLKVLEFRNKKLAQRIEQRMRTESELRTRIEQLEKRQMQDDAVLNVVNRYWNQLNEDIRVLLQRFDAETADELDSVTNNEATSFLMQLSTWDKDELDEKLANRVQVSKRAVVKIVHVIDCLMQRNERITMALQQSNCAEAAAKKAAAEKSACDSESGAAAGSAENNALDETLRQSYVDIMAENRNLHNLNTSLHEKFHIMSLKMKQHQDALTAKETENAELRNHIDELQYELEKVQCRNDKLEHHLAETIEKLKAYHQLYGDSNKSATAVQRSSSQSNVNSAHYEELQKDLEEFRELANNRLQELDKLHAKHRETLKELEKLKMDIKHLPESVIVETTEYKCLQSQFSVLYNESMQMKTLLDETRSQLHTSKNQHLHQIEIMETEELNTQKKLRSEMIQLEDMLAQIRSEYELLRIEFKQTMAANEQTTPINREMRHLITSLQNHNVQLKGEVQRYKSKYKEAFADVVKLRKDMDEMIAKFEGGSNLTATAGTEQEAGGANAKEDANASNTQNAAGDNSSIGQQQQQDGSAGVNIKAEAEDEEMKDHKDGIKTEKATSDADKKEMQTDGSSGLGSVSDASSSSGNINVKSERGESKDHKLKEAKVLDSEIVRDLKAQIKKAMNDNKEMKVLLDMYKCVPKDTRDKALLMAQHNKLSRDYDELKLQLKKLTESKREERKKLADEEAMRKIKLLEDQLQDVQKQLTNQKTQDASNMWGAGTAGAANYAARTFAGSAEEEALLQEMEVTGQAFEDMQEQNSRLIEQLREKDDANFKLMSERIKSHQVHKLLVEEKQLLEDQMATRDAQIENMHLVLRKLEEKERILQAAVATIEKELMLRQQAMEMHKRKAIESAQSAADLRLHLEKYHSQMKEAQQVVAEKTSLLEAEAYKTKRSQEELAQFRRKADRMKKMEMQGTTIDEVMMEEIREYKETLTCPSCKVKRKDAILSKCFHVFCYDCLRTRYETRQRKCPKCNCAFGANDYHRVYLT